MNKQELIRRNKRYSNLPHFDLGTVPINTGYQKATNDQVINSVDSPAADMSGSAKAQWGQNIQEGLTKTAGLVQNYGSDFKSGFNKIFNPGTTARIAAANGDFTQNIIANTLATKASTQAANSAFNSAAAQFTPVVTQSWLPESTSFAANSIVSKTPNVTANVVKDISTGAVDDIVEHTATEGAAQGAGKGLASTLGKAAGVIGALYSGYNMYNDILGLQDNIGYQLKDLSSQNTESVGGVAYKTYGGYDESAVNKYTSAQNAGSKINMTLDGAGIGAGVGSLIGPVGSLVGGAVGALAGLLGGVFGSNHRKTRLEQLKRNWATASTAWNDQNYAEAASQAMRADLGKDPTYTTAGTTNMPVNAKVGRGETLYNPEEGTATVVDRGVKRADDQDAFLRPQDAVLGNLMDPTVGKTYAQQAEPYARHLEFLNSLLNKNGNSITQEIQQREIDKAKQQDLAQLDMITQKQKIHHMLKANCGKTPSYKCGKTPKYAFGKDEIISVLPGLAEMAVGALQTGSYAKDPIQAYNSFVPNAYAQKALNVLGGLHYDPYNQLQASNDAVRQGLYQMYTNPYSLGQRMNMQTALFNNAMRTKADIYNAAQEANNKYAATYGDALLKTGEAEAARAQQANAIYYDNLAKAYAARRRGQEMGWNTALKGGNTIAGNLLNNLWTNYNIGLYQQKLDLDKQQILAMANKPKKE